MRIEFTRAYPDVVLEVTTDDSPLDFVAGRYDASIHLGEFIARDMIAVRESQEQRAAIVAAPRYFESHPRPASPRELTRHRCISISMGTAGPYRWEFDRGTESLTVDVHGPLVLDDMDVAIRAAMDGIAWRFRSRNMSRRTSQAARSYESSKTGVHRSPASSCITPADASSPRRCQH